jgi:SSS family solute:Na+ symporter
MMNLGWVDWVILAAAVPGLLLSGYLCRKCMRGVADYLVAGRHVGRYLGLGSDAMQGIGAVTILAFWQMNYKAGLAGFWWYMLTPAAGIIVALTGWGIYRFRQTRAMTLGEFVEMRYGRRTRVFFGLLVYLAGVLNMGIFPAVGAGFFIHYCGLPAHMVIAGIELPTLLPVMLVLVGAALALCLWGGQVTVIVTDFIQSAFVNVILIAIVVIIYQRFTWTQVVEAYTAAPQSDALLNPFRGAGASEFNRWFFLIHVYYWMIYSVISWAPNTILVGSARDAHEARMMRVMLHLRSLAMVGLGLFVLPLAAYVLMHHPDFAGAASQVNAVLGNIENEQVRSQMVTPTAIIHVLPVGLIGAFAAVVLAAFITTHDTYLLAWGGAFIQDVVLPVRRRPLPAKQHIAWLRFSSVLVAAFIVLFSLFFEQVDNIFMFMDISASVYTGAAGVILLGGLYWRRGTAFAAWTTMILGGGLSVAGLVCRSLNPDFLDGRIMAFWISIACIAIYVISSLLSSRTRVRRIHGTNPATPPDDRCTDCDRETASHRQLAGAGTSRADACSPEAARPCESAQNKPVISRSDRVLMAVIWSGVILFLFAFGATCVVNTRRNVPTVSWITFWHVYLFAMFGFGTLFLIWITAGGLRDLVRLVRDLRTLPPDAVDDGISRSRHAPGSVAHGQ